ncbi:MAG: ROK family protein [Deltaproteobacteria bacterium]|nr:ROK family protein [Deltaproteobacteria bacterium]
MKKILNAIEETRHSIKGKKLAGIGLGIPGIIAPETGTVIQSPNLTGWVNFNIKDVLADKLPWPLYVENDANAFALGEGWAGAAIGINNFCCLTLGTGVGSGIVLNGRLWRGVDGFAGEIGHIVVEPDGASCGCGSWGCLERYVSANGLVRMAEEGKDDRLAAPLLKSCGGVHGVSAKAIADFARHGDPFCIGLFKRLARYLGIGLADIVNLLNIEMIVIGGGLSNVSDLFLASAKEEMLKRSFKVPGRRVKVVAAKLGENGGILGAAFIAVKAGAY